VGVVVPLKFNNSKNKNIEKIHEETLIKIG
jgi:hypothetical protein